MTDEEESSRRLRDLVHVTLIICCVFTFVTNLHNQPSLMSSLFFLFVGLFICRFVGLIDGLFVGLFVGSLGSLGGHKTRSQISICFLV